MTSDVQINCFNQGSPEEQNKQKVYMCISGNTLIDILRIRLDQMSGFPAAQSN